MFKKGPPLITSSSPEARPGLPPVLLTRQELAALVCAVKQTHARQPFRAALSTTLPKLQALAIRKDSTPDMP